MPICEICGWEIAEANKCSKCEANFCGECGNIKRKLCYDCLRWEDENLDEAWSYEEAYWDVVWHDDEPH